MIEQRIEGKQNVGVMTHDYLVIPKISPHNFCNIFHQKVVRFASTFPGSVLEDSVALTKNILISILL